ncbi:MAG: MtrB/PioB family decaheme-associated outer membrane protein [Gallionellaceae bacterium]|nr:MtrB/PioB family decaheme-associated outer membrane protein [Gallionellaceae bacterium]
MKNHQAHFALSKTVAAIHAALLAMAAIPLANAAPDPAVAELTTPDKTFEVGVVDVSKKSYKFGEYNGLYRDGARVNANVDMVGKSVDESATRWSVLATDLGLDTRRLEAEGGQQGRFNIHFLYDELPHKLSDSFRTIYNGAGSTALTLPATYPAAATRLGVTTTGQQVLSNWNNLQSPNAVAQPLVTDNAMTGPAYLVPSLMHNEDIGFKRTKVEGGLSYILHPGWEIKFAARQDKKDGTKLTGYAFASSSTAAMLIEPISFRTNGFDVALGYIGEKANMNLTYLYSTFQNDINAWTAATPFAGVTGTVGVYNNQALLSSAPESQMHQVKLAGGYRFTPTTRLSYEGTTARTTQNSNFNCQVNTGVTGCVSGVNSWIVPVGSANAKVASDTFAIKLTSHPINKLNLAAAYKYDHRDNQTPVNTFNVRFADQTGAANSSITNDPINTTKNLFTLDADYALARSQAVKLGYQLEDINRSTDGNGFAPSRTIATGNTNDFSLPVHKTKEDTWTLEYRNSMLSDVTGRLSYAQSTRRALDYSTPTFAATTNDATLIQYAYYTQFRDYFVADRTRDKIRGAFNYQVNDAWALGFSADYNRDKYKDAAFKQSDSTILNVDLSYAASEKMSLNTFYSREDRDSKLAGKYLVSSTTAGAKVNGVAATNLLGGACNVANHPCILANWDWNMSQADKVDTWGVGAKYKGFISSKLDMNADLLYIQASTPVSAGGGGSLVSDGAAAPDYTWFAPGSYPKITSKTTQLRLTGNYMIDKSQAVRVSYMYQHLKSSDWQYDAYTNPVAMQSFIGTGQTSPNHTVNAIAVSYLYSFK